MQFSDMFYLKKNAYLRRPLRRMKEYDSTRSRDRLLNFNVILPLIVVKMISQDCCQPPFVRKYLHYVCIQSMYVCYFTYSLGLL